MRTDLIHYLSLFSALVPDSKPSRAVRFGSVWPYYHAVSDEPLPHIRHLYMPRSFSQFKKDVEWLATNFRILPFEDALKSYAEPSGAKTAFFLSFDDGLSEYYNIIHPFLKSKGIPSAVFINPDFVDNNALFFRYKVSLLIEHLQQNPSAVRSLENELRSTGLNPMKLKLTQIRRADPELDRWAGMCGLDYSAFLRDKKPYMTWEQINSLVKEGVVAGAHSMNHPYFSEISPAEQLKQICDSAEMICRKTGRMQKYFAFPFTDSGVSLDTFNKMYEPDACGIDYSFGGAGLKKELCNRHIQRIPMEGTRFGAPTILKSEYLYYKIKGIFGRNTVRRK